MSTDLTIDVAALDDPHRRALEEVIGRQLAANERLIIAITEVEVESVPGPRPPQKLEDWTNVYDGLSDEGIEAIDEIAKTRANLSRNAP